MTGKGDKPRFCYEYGSPNGWRPVVYYGHIDTTYRKIARTNPIVIDEEKFFDNGEPNFGRLIAAYPKPIEPPTE